MAAASLASSSATALLKSPQRQRRNTSTAVFESPAVAPRHFAAPSIVSRRNVASGDSSSHPGHVLSDTCINRYLLFVALAVLQL